MEDLPELPFEQILSYLSLEDRLKARAVSRVWRNTFDRYPVKSLCYSARSSEFIYGKNRWISGAFVENFISTTRFATFFDTFNQTILSTLKHLRLYDLDLNGGDQVVFARILNSFGQLEQLDIIWTEFNQPNLQFNLNLPMLTSLQLEDVNGIQKLTLEAPRLRRVKILDCSETSDQDSDQSSDLRLEIIPGESVERLLVNRWEYTEMKLKNLQFLYVDYLPRVDSTFLSSLQQLKEVHTNGPESVSKLFEQKQRSGRADLKIYLCGLLLNGPDDPATNALRDCYPGYLSRELLVCLAENRSRLADEISFYRSLDYSDIEFVAPCLDVDLLKRCIDLNEVAADSPVQDIERFLNLLKNCYIVELNGDQPQDLFDRLPEHSAVQKLTIYKAPSDLGFVFRLKHLIHLNLSWSIDTATVRRAFQELPALSYFSFWYDQKTVLITHCHPKQFLVSRDWHKEKTVSDLNAAIEYIFGKEKPNSPKKRKSDALE